MIQLSNSNGFTSTQSGTSLIGVAVLTLVMGFLITGAIYLLQNYDTIKSDQQSIDTSIALQEGLRNYVAMNKRYPCPARIDIAPDQAGFGLEDCSITDVNGRNNLPVKVGMPPVRTINVPDKMMLDGYGKRHIYAVTSDMTSTSPLPNLRNDLGAIFIHDENGNPISQADGYVIYALLSPGVNDHGAYDAQGALLRACDPTAGIEAAENCDGDAVFISSSVKTFRGEDGDFTHSFAFKGSALAYSWQTGAWSECGQNTNGVDWNGTEHPVPACFSSFQARNISCVDRQGNVVPVANEQDEEFCGHTPRPAEDRVCSLGPCRWQVIPAQCT